jgi:SepF-like predicted cell division protein (DUF552 family)
MGILDKVFGKKGEEEGRENLDELLSGATQDVGDAVNPPAKMYIKKISIRNDGDADLIMKELSGGNIMIIDITPLANQPNKLKSMVEKVKMVASKTNGDLAALSDKMIIATPAGIKIVKSKKAAE